MSTNKRKAGTKPSERASKRARLESKESDNDDMPALESAQSIMSDWTLPVVPFLTNDWVRASSTRNYALGDPVVDWLDQYGEIKGLVPDTKRAGYDERLDFRRFIMAQGQAFEAQCMKHLRSRFGTDLVEMTETIPSDRMRNTLLAMQRGIPIIAQGTIWEPKTRIYGSPDLLVRSDYLNRLVDLPVVSEHQSGCEFSPSWHYRVVDIKFATLHLKADMTTLLNQGSMKAYKAQICIYNVCLTNMQGYDPKRAYLLGRGWECRKNRQIIVSPEPFSKLGVVDFCNSDFNVISIAADATIWYRNMVMKGREWSILPTPSVPELYPNMCIASATGWDKTRGELAQQLKEITLIWQCGTTARENAHEQGILSWDDPRCVANTLGINGPRLGPQVDTVLAVNRQTDTTIVPRRIGSKLYGWRRPNKYEFFVDVEAVSSIYSLEPGTTGTVYMIGIGWTEQVENTSQWKYSSLVSDGLDEKSEQILAHQFLDVIIQLTKGNEKNPIKFYHYSGADFTLMDRMFQKLEFNDTERDRNAKSILGRIEWCDLYRLIREEPVVIKGALDFSLKSIVRALKDQGKINVSYDNLAIGSGMDGLLAAVRAAEQKDVGFKEHDLIKKTIIYNEIDCKSVYELLHFFRSEL